jgi:hypothetical protein
MKKIAGLVLWALTGALLNLGTMFLFQDALRLPLFMDTLFTAAFTFFGGLPCGIATAIVSHLVMNPLLATDLPNHLYTLCSIAVALITAFFMRLFPAECSAGLGYRSGAGAAGPARFIHRSGPLRREGEIFDRIAVLFVLSLVMCVGVSLLGGLISTVIETFFTPRNTYDADIFIFRRMLARKGLPLLLVEVLCRIPVNILDRLISVFGGYGFALGLTTLTKGIGGKPRGGLLTHATKGSEIEAI